MIREYELEDCEAVQKYASIPEVVKYMPWGPNTPAQTNEFIKQAQNSKIEHPRQLYELAIEFNELVVGGCNLKLKAKDVRSAEVGYCLSPTVWGNGFANEAVNALLKFAFFTLKLQRVYAEIDPENINSSKVAERIGMRQENLIRGNKSIRGEWRDTAIYGILADDFNSGKADFN